MNSIYQIFTIAKKEYMDALKNKVFIVFVSFLLLLAGVSMIVSSFDFQVKVNIYQTALVELQASHQVVQNLVAPQFYPLQLLRGTIEYIEIIGAILAMILGYLCIAKEKGNNTLQLLFTRPVSKIKFFIGKFLGNTLLLASVSGFMFFGIYLIISFIGKTLLTGIEIEKILLSFLFSVVYLSSFFSISVLLALIFKSLSNSLILSFVIWIVFVLVVPQIGDTLDPDNQVPGGLFNKIGITQKSDQLIILKDFSSYEKTRDSLEQSSFTKHYERLVFALLGIKDTYNVKTVDFIIKDKNNDIWWLISAMVVFGSVSSIIFTKKKLINN
ncbi:MAG: ABC transporter permease subunit [Patescibacteria group bacterium]